MFFLYIDKCATTTSAGVSATSTPARQTTSQQPLGKYSRRSSRLCIEALVGACNCIVDMLCYPDEPPQSTAQRPSESAATAAVPPERNPAEQEPLGKCTRLKLCESHLI